ncbi:MAG: sigma-70 family RNA polymerase sigma factor [Pirellulales bacterium]|nr:sigma-70 family RNA polymerase sigma factor [Pirellulales bacterium]
MDNMPDQRRFSDARRTEEFLELYSSCQHSLYVYIVTLIGNPIDAHDVLQDTNLVLWEKFDQFEPGTNFNAWAREIARYRVLRYRQVHANDMPILEPRVLDALARRIDEVDRRRDDLYAEKLLGCIEQLGNADRELIKLRYTGSVQVKVLAERLRRSENAVSQSLGRIRRLLRKCVEESMKRSEEGDLTG